MATIDDVSEAPQSSRRVPSGRGNPGLGDIARSVVGLAVVLLLVWWVAGWFRVEPTLEPEPVDYRAVAGEVASAASYDLLVPAFLPTGWRATQATWDPLAQQWHLGLRSDDDAYVGVEQSATADADDLVTTYAPEADAAGTVEVEGEQWQFFTDDAGRSTLVRTAGAVTVLVTGGVEQAEIATFVETLQPVSGERSRCAPSCPSDSGPQQPATTEPAPPPRPVSIQALVEQDYDGSDLRMRGLLGDYGAYTRHAVTYRSDGLTISGIMNVPAGRGPFPSVVLNHGYIDPADYVSGQGLSREQDYLARRGFVVLHTDYRNHAGSDADPKSDVQLRLGYTADAVNAVLALKRSELPVDRDRMGLLGRSMGGGVTYNALVVRPGLVDAAVVYAPVSSLAVQNFDRWIRDDPEDTGLARRILDRYGTPRSEPRFWRDVSPRPFFDRITEPVLIHHGTADTTCPPGWSRATVQAMQQAGVRARLVTYPGEEHAFIAQWELSMQRTVAFLDRTLR